MANKSKAELVARLMSLFGMTREEARASIRATERGLKDIAEGRVTPLSQIEKAVKER